MIPFFLLKSLYYDRFPHIYGGDSETTFMNSAEGLVFPYMEGDSTIPVVVKQQAKSSSYTWGLFFINKIYNKIDRVSRA